ncbi:MAG: DUF2945 domain-containing protein [Alphaproteobacteria bacterium]|nr:DUF2945 domain-containing protein [Alphaproteobacteria bacterium]
MAAKLKTGDKVHWNTSQGITEGEVVRKVTTKTKIMGHVAKPDPAHPQYVVESAKTGAHAVHKAAALKKG